MPALDRERGILEPVLVVGGVEELHGEIGLRLSEGIVGHLRGYACGVEALVGLCQQGTPVLVEL